EQLRAAVLQDDVVVRVGDEHGVTDAVHHPPEPLLLDRMRFACLPKELDVSLQAERLTGLTGKRHERVDVGLRYARGARQQDDTSPLPARFAAKRGDAFSVPIRPLPLARP